MWPPLTSRRQNSRRTSFPSSNQTEGGAEEGEARRLGRRRRVCKSPEKCGKRHLLPFPEPVVREVLYAAHAHPLRWRDHHRQEGVPSTLQDLNPGKWPWRGPRTGWRTGTSRLGEERVRREGSGRDIEGDPRGRSRPPAPSAVNLQSAGMAQKGEGLGTDRSRSRVRSAAGHLCNSLRNTICNNLCISL